MQTIETEYLKACPIYGGRKKADRGTIFSDLKAAAGVFADMRKARKDGSEIVLEKKKVFPVISSGGFYNTVEGCILNGLEREITQKAQEAFDALPDEVKYQLQFAPKSGEFARRTNLWRAALKPVMTDKQYRIAMKTIIDWYIQIKQMQLRKGGAI